MTRDAATAAGINAVQAISKYTGNAKALAEGDADGFVQVTAERENGSSARMSSGRATRCGDYP